jgi:hypothetical protein
VGELGGRTEAQQLLKRAIGRDLPDQLAIGKYPRRYSHVRTRLHGQLPHEVSNLAESVRGQDRPAPRVSPVQADRMSLERADSICCRLDQLVRQI